MGSGDTSVRLCAFLLLDLRGDPENRGFGDDAQRLVEGGGRAAKRAEVDPALLPQRPIKDVE